MVLTAAQLAQARAAQESIMTATVEVYAYREGWDVVDGVDTPRLGELVYRGPGRVQDASVGSGQTAAGSIPLTERAYAGAVPHHVPLTPGQTVIIVDGAADVLAPGRWLRIEAATTNTVAATCRRFTATAAYDLKPRS